MKLVKTTRTEYELFIRHGIIDPWYRIEKTRCSSQAQFDKWIKHLQEKNWFTQDHQTQFEAVWKEAK